MKNITYSARWIALVLLLTISAASFGQSQSALNATQGKILQQADKQLNAVYQKILQQYGSDKAFINNLKAAQRIWIQSREADVKMKYPSREAGFYGSAQPMCEATYRTELTRQRTKFLTTWLTGIPEGDVCTGSVKMKH